MPSRNSLSREEDRSYTHILMLGPQAEEEHMAGASGAQRVEIIAGRGAGESFRKEFMSK